MSDTILIVDDDADIRLALSMILADEGYVTQLASDGIDALSQLKNLEPPGLILLDLMMPNLNGEQVLERIKADPALAEIPVIVLSGEVLSDERLERLRADDFMLKPVELEDLLSIIQRYVRHRSGDHPS